MLKEKIVVGILLAGLAGCASRTDVSQYDPQGAKPSKTKIIHLQSKSGSSIKGTLTLQQYPEGLVVKGTITGLTPGKHGFHFHEKGDCSAADASSAGGHFMLPDQEHGSPDDSNSHLGDLGNILANDKGIAEFNILAKGVTIADPKSKNSLIKRSMVIHGGEDDLSTQPAGNSGPRVACAVIR